jgi:hypothetical protein
MERTLLILRIALRNIRRQVRRSLLTASAMVLGIGLLMFVRSCGGRRPRDVRGVRHTDGSGPRVR